MKWLTVYTYFQKMPKSMTNAKALSKLCTIQKTKPIVVKAKDCIEDYKIKG